MRIVIIGTGNTATVFGRLLKEAGHSIIQVFGRTLKHAQELSNILHTSCTVDQQSLNIDADIYIIAVSDVAITNVASWLRVDKKLVVHTAGSVKSDVLSPTSKNYGVFYPLQSLRKGMDSIPRIPFLIEGNTEDNAAMIHDFAQTISKDVQFANTEQRLMMHIAAIMVNNFTNHLYVMAENFCTREHIDFKILLPLIEETASRLREFSPVDMQTGPAIRNDLNTIEKHIQLLERHPFHQSVYKFLTERIQQWKQLQV